jgi:hypothetical protein
MISSKLHSAENLTNVQSRSLRDSIKQLIDKKKVEILKVIEYDKLIY